MSMNTFDAFGPLDDLIQVIYQGTHRFILLSHVDFDSLVPSWQVYLGLADKGRWWEGKWEGADVDTFVGKNVSSELLEAFADNIARTLVQGELFVGDVNSGVEPGKDIKLVFDPNGPKPLSIPLSEMTQQEVGVLVTNEFFALGLNAQKRKCKLNPPAFPTYTNAPVVSHENQHQHRHSPPPSPARQTRKASGSPQSTPPRKIDHLKAKQLISPLRKADREKEPDPTAAPESDAGPKPKRGPVKKKARKVQQMEFGSDDE